MIENLEKIKEILSDLMSIEGVRSAIITSSDGLPIEIASLDNEFDADTVSALVSTIKGASTSIFSECLGGRIKNVLIEGSSAKILIRPITNEYLLALVLDAHANLGMINIAITKYLEDLKNLVSEQ